MRACKAEVTRFIGSMDIVFYRDIFEFGKKKFSIDDVASSRTFQRSNFGFQKCVLLRVRHGYAVGEVQRNSEAEPNDLDLKFFFVAESFRMNRRTVHHYSKETTSEVRSPNSRPSRWIVFIGYYDSIILLVLPSTR